MNIEHSSRIWLPRTGMTTSYAAGDDGYFQAGNPRKTRFVDNLNGTVSDRATCLTWVKDPAKIIPGATGVHSSNQIQAARGDWAKNTAYALADLAKDTVGSTYWVCVSAHTSVNNDDGFAAARAGADAGKWRQTVWTASAANLTTPATMTWANAVAYALGTNKNPTTGLAYAGFADWRLPNIDELRSIRLLQLSLPPVDPAFACALGYYWSSTQYIADPTVQAQIEAFHTYYKVTSINALSTLYYVRPVRGGRLNANS